MSVSPIGRVVEIAEDGRHLSKERGFLKVSCGSEELGRVPLDDVAKGGEAAGRKVPPLAAG